MLDYINGVFMFAKIAVIFPGVGYNKYMPLLYFSNKLAAGKGFKVKSLDFKGFPQRLKGDREAMMYSFQLAISQAEEQLRFISFKDYEDVVFISKSIGSVAASIYATKHFVPARQLYFTPLEQAFSLMKDENGIVFCGSDDTWVNKDLVISECEKKHLELHTIENVGHSLENEDLPTSLRDFADIMTIVDRFLS